MMNGYYGKLIQVTHYLFSIGLTFRVISLFRTLEPGCLAMAIWLSISVNYLIDLLGHRSRKRTPSRSWITHSIFTAPTLGGLVGGFTFTVVSEVLAFRPVWTVVASWMVIGVIIAISHLLLDSLTGAGVYFIQRRIALAHFKYNNKPLNLGFILTGVFLVASSLR